MSVCFDIRRYHIEKEKRKIYSERNTHSNSFDTDTDAGTSYEIDMQKGQHNKIRTFQL